MMNVVEPSPSSETTPASTAVATTRRTGSLRTAFRMKRISGSNRPTSIIVPKKMIAKNSSVAVGAKSLIELHDGVDDAVLARLPDAGGRHDQRERQRHENERQRGRQPFGQDQVHEHGDHGEAEKDEHLRSLIR